MQVLVVGGAGYIGSVTVEELLRAGHEVVVMDSLISGHSAAVHPEAELVIGDARDDEALGHVFASHRFDAVMHFAAYIQAGESVRHPGRYFANNLGSLLCVLNAMVAYDVGILVFSSSAAVYGSPTRIPIDEDAPLCPASPYGESKALGERLLPWFRQAHGMRYVSLRYFNAAGATGRLGEDHRPESHLIPIALEVAMGRRLSLPVYGAQYPTRDGTCIRDYVHVLDLARAHVLALHHLAKGSEGGAFNLGGGQGHSVLEVVETVRRVTRHPVPIKTLPPRPGDPPILVASWDKAKQELGWQPAHTLEDMVSSAWEWMQRHPNGYPD